MSAAQFQPSSRSADSPRPDRMADLVAQDLSTFPGTSSGRRQTARIGIR